MPAAYSFVLPPRTIWSYQAGRVVSIFLCLLVGEYAPDLNGDSVKKNPNPAAAFIRSASRRAAPFKRRGRASMADSRWELTIVTLVHNYGLLFGLARRESLIR
jgi:hypothetical protein